MLPSIALVSRLPRSANGGALGRWSKMTRVPPLQKVLGTGEHGSIAIAELSGTLFRNGTSTARLLSARYMCGTLSAAQDRVLGEIG